MPEYSIWGEKVKLTLNDDEVKAIARVVDLVDRVSRAEGIVSRIMFDRGWQDDPINRCLTLLSEGRISIGKAGEWLVAYLLTGVEQPIADGTREIVLGTKDREVLNGDAETASSV
jgi:hypothetical protein